MSRPPLAVVVLLLALSVATVASGLPQQSTQSSMPLVDPAPGEPNYLAINGTDVAASNSTTMDLDVGSAIASDRGSLEAAFIDSKFEAAYENASTDEEARERVIDRFAARLANGTTRLEERDRQNIEELATGSISVGQFLDERARINARAEKLQQVTSDIISSVPRSFWSELYRVEGRLAVLQGPISSRMSDSTTGGGSPTSVYAEVSGSGYTIGAISGEEYVRETYLGDERRPEQADQFPSDEQSGLSVAQNRALELYPWVRDNQQNPSAARGFGPIYRVLKGFPGGELRVFLHGSTTNVFREAQTRNLASINTTNAINRTDGSLRLVVNRTFPTGPAEISLLHADTGAMVDGTVTVGDGDPISLGGDGHHWMIQPREPVRIEAAAGTSNVTATLDPS